MYQQQYPPPRNVNAIIIGVAVALIAAIITAGLIVADNRDDKRSGRQACKEALAEVYALGVEESLADQESEDRKPPPACLFLDTDEVMAITGEIMQEYLDSPEADKAFEDAMRKSLESAWPSETP
ncbi:hypothetical protein OIE75_29620 [Streptomyces sp. NBC_01723]|uniref:hypothetical protein n=1 Tax=Streptomyces sp. NBC_01723 TaxID=2975921 RepID=UPI002E370CEA|nr:hypothetical protein [Streptomyces sp. NBC_01723]